MHDTCSFRGFLKLVVVPVVTSSVGGRGIRWREKGIRVDGSCHKGQIFCSSCGSHTWPVAHENCASQYALHYIYPLGQLQFTRRRSLLVRAWPQHSRQSCLWLLPAAPWVSVQPSVSPSCGQEEDMLTDTRVLSCCFCTLHLSDQL